MINTDNVIITVIDADSLAPRYYFSEIEKHLNKKPHDRHRAIFSGPQIFTRNNLETTISVRIMDLVHSYMHMSHMPSIFFSFPLSNYSLSYKMMMEKIGGWDTCSLAVGEDFHTVQKAYWKTKGDIVTIPIYVPWNQLSL